MIKLSHQYNFNKVYQRLYKNAISYQFLKLIEQLTIWKQILILNICFKKSISQIESLKIFWFLHIDNQLRCFIFKFIAGLNPHLTMLIFYKKTQIFQRYLYQFIKINNKDINNEGRNQICQIFNNYQKNLVFIIEEFYIWIYQLF
ncbi:unnamed protein product [Paramecium primaurelia]|uniref:Uncharacterized protein n=1 Tax=Paramecium primaurelia TaxID=5886 RepID=A0A8S1JPC1_PARPR|nr:unnamed protein product [Paramecium primaurelia]